MCIVSSHASSGPSKRMTMTEVRNLGRRKELSHTGNLLDGRGELGLRASAGSRESEWGWDREIEESHLREWWDSRITEEVEIGERNAGLAWRFHRQSAVLHLRRRSQRRSPFSPQS